MTLPMAEALYRRGDHAAARKLLGKIMKAGQSLASVHRLLGYMAGKEGDFREAMQRLRTSLQYDPRCAETWYFLGVAAQREGQHASAVAAFLQLLHLQPDVFEAHHDLGLALLASGKVREALKHFEHACQLRPGSFEAHMNKGAALGKLRLHAQEVAAYEKALAIAPAHPALIENYGTALCEAKRFEEAAALYARTWTAFPNDPAYAFALGGLCYAKLRTADWSGLDDLTHQLRLRIQAGDACIEPFALFLLPSTPQEQLRIAQGHAAALYPVVASALHRADRIGGARERLRIGYLSADFGRHATSYLVVQALEQHDRTRFEVSAIALTPDDGSAMRCRISRAVTHFVDAHALCDREAAQRIADLRIDVLVDLGGYTRNARPGILALRPAPVQVSYLGFPGTMGAPFVDYLIADAVVLPQDECEAYSEKIIWMPHSYQPNDTHRAKVAQVPTRASVGLPEAGFVFCSFNSGAKLNAACFAIWMRLLAQVPDSVLWLRSDTPIFEENLRRHALAQGIDPARLIFAPWAAQEAHIARIALADLCLDNLPYNAHTTASDALWAGVPLLTCKGNTFAGRVASSLLLAAGLPELVTQNAGDYEALALSLATDRARLSALRERLAAARETCALFDTPAYTRHLEAGYEQAGQRHCAGQPLAHVRIGEGA